MREPGFSAFEKRVKRHVIARPRAFFVSAPPGFEQISARELAWDGFIETGDTVCEKGGVLFTGRVHDGYAANLHLRTANRVLMRIDEVSAQNFRRLGKKVEDIPWELYLYPDVPIRISVTTRRSRLYHTDAVSKCVRAGIEARIANATSKGAGLFSDFRRPQRVFVRGFEDVFTISLDSSGELLYKRGLKSHGGKAPIRETLAAAILLFSGFRPGDLLVDPMCGSGTFSLEAAMMSTHTPAGWFRDFAFMGWPCFRRTRWEYMRRQSESRIVFPKEPVIWACDLDPNACRRLERTVSAHGFSSAVSVLKRDFFDLLPSLLDGMPQKNSKRLLVLNPPYGRRMSAKMQPDDFYAEIGKKLACDFKNWRVAILAPGRKLAAKMPFLVRVYPVFHGGLSLWLFLGRVC